MSGGDVPAADDLFAAFLEDVRDGGGDFEELCAAHPEHAVELRGLHERWYSMDDLVGGLGGRDPGDGSRSPVESLFARSLDQLADGDPGPENDARAGLVLGSYRLERTIGRGGLGTVHLGRRVDDEFEQRVAIKLLRRGMDTDDLLERFRLERQVLADLDHPHIARLFDGGTTEDGRPYIVMELVDGQPLDEYCDTRQLPVEGRLELFVKVCEAVHHAHQRGVVHRDLKPSNILVTGNGEPKLLDFGIAKLVDERGEAWDVTAAGMRLMTPEYAAPEQVTGETISPATDVYALGVILYELLSGRRPHSPSRRAREDLERAIREEVPRRPSAAVRKPMEHPDELISPEECSRRFGTSSTRLASQLSGDLDRIVLMALRKEPERRYARAIDIAEDVRRKLAGHPVLAVPDTVGYRVSKFVGRNRVLVTATAVTIVALGAGLTLAELGRREAQRSREDVMRLSALVELEDLEARADELWPVTPERLGDYEEWLSRAADQVAGLYPRTGDAGHYARREELRGRGRARRSPGAEEHWEFSSDEDRWWHGQNEMLIERLEELQDPDHGLIRGISTEHGWGIERRRDLADELTELALAGGDSAARWTEMSRAIAAEPLYGGLSIRPQTGLVPIGPDPLSGLWEFAHLPSGARAERGADGALVLTPDTGIVLVLIPGGSCWMGAQGTDPNRRNFDPLASAVEGPVREVELSPYFLSKFEMTQAQWTRVAGDHPSTIDHLEHGEITRLHPVENVSWERAHLALHWLGLELPTDAQWEYGVRGGTSTPWWTGSEERSLTDRGAANVIDQAYVERDFAWAEITEWPNFDDGFPVHAPVDALESNPFGLHHALGNVWEWCLDNQAQFPSSAARDPVARIHGDHNRVYRGGSFDHSVRFARVTVRMDDPANFADFDVGIRPARGIEE